MNNYNLKNKLINIPKKPGCYLFKNKYDDFIYVGKAKNLFNRVNSYFKNNDNKSKMLREEIVNLEYIITNNEKESLILEINLIQKHQPKYNIALNDNKSYPYIAIENKPYYKYKIIRKLNQKYYRVYGPLPDGSKARQIFNLLQIFYPLKKCNLTNSNKPCLYYQINQCSGSCFKKIDPNYNKNIIQNIDKLFSGKTDDIKKNILSIIMNYADNLQFEQAQKYKEILEKVEWIFDEQNVTFKNKGNYDVISSYQDEHYVVYNRTIYRMGLLISNEQKMFYAFNHEHSWYFNSIYKDIKQKITIIHDINVEILIDNPFIKIKKINKSDDKQKLLISYKNAKDYLANYYLSPNSNIQKNTALFDELRDLLNIEQKINKIDIFDVSNLYKDNPVGAVITYEFGKAIYKKWRHYKLDTVLSYDPHRMQDLVYRHYNNTNNKHPDLIILDGALEHIKSVKTILDSLNINSYCIGLTKDSDHNTNYITNQNLQKIKLNKNSNLFYFLFFLQEQIHNYAINYFRKTKIKKDIKSILLSIPGVSLRMVNLLNTNIGSIYDIQKTNFDIINSIIKNKNTTNKIINFLNEYIKN